LFRNAHIPTKCENPKGRKGIRNGAKFTEETYGRLSGRFPHTISSASAKLLQIPARKVSSRARKVNGSPREIIGHLIDSASNNHQRFVRAQFSDDLVFAGYEQEGWVRVQNYQTEDWTDLVQLWRLYNQHILNVMSNVPEETRTSLRYKHNCTRSLSDNLSEAEPVTLDWFMRDYGRSHEKTSQQIIG